MSSSEMGNTSPPPKQKIEWGDDPVVNSQRWHELEKDTIWPMVPRTFSHFQEAIGNWGKEKGWNMGIRDIPEKLMLVVSECSEALEAYRDHSEPHIVYMKTGKPEGIGIELADAVIRILHMADQLGMDMGECIAMKMTYNQSRPFRHGGKKA